MRSSNTKTRLLGFAPDADTTQRGVIVDGDMFYPNLRGIRAMPTMENAPMNAVLPAAPSATAWARATDDDEDFRVYAWASDKLYVSHNRQWTEVWSGVGVGAPTAWQRFGKVTLVASSTVGLRVQDGTNAAFTDVANTPKCKVLFAVDGYLVAANGDMTGVNAAAENENDAWATSNLFDYQEWDPEAAGSVASFGRLYTPPGEITAGAALGSFGVLYKRNSINIGQHNGIDTFEWVGVENDAGIGCIGPNALVAAEGAHWFMSDTDFYRFDGAAPVSIGEDIREYVFNRHRESTLAAAQCIYDKVRKCVIWMIDGEGYAFSTVSKRWGRCNYGNGIFVKGLHDAPYIYEFEPGGHVLGTGYRPSVMMFPFTGGLQETLRVTRDEYYESHLITGDAGDDDLESDIVHVRTRFNRAPSTAELTHYCRQVFHEDPYTGKAWDGITLEGDRFTVREQAKWHRHRIDLSGDWELSMIDQYAPKGTK